ncbi:uroporphyrinogen-III synthase [Bacillus tuaregi]|uniref:uroporphyrinogen-III synthase n=1 Tax=Bacillus tuaregi TaxID=1816695 RepID=UPI0008F8D2E6|nr:uroporphyrinogen-III synthase [Bacillus tuaregi]
MGKSLTGKKIVLGASRKIEEMTALIEKQGGTALVRTLQGTVFKADAEVRDSLLAFTETGADWVIFTTGIGFQTLLELAEESGRKEAFIKQLQKAKIATRGYKAAAALKQYGLMNVASDDDGTTQGLIRQLKEVDFSGQRVTVQLHGEKAPGLMNFLAEKGAVTTQLLPYQHIPPVSDTVDTLCQEILAGEVDAVCFTTAIQAHSLFSFAQEKGISGQLLTAFESQTVATAVGKVTAEALREVGVNRIVVPTHERMGAMIVELANYYDEKKE